MKYLLCLSLLILFSSFRGNAQNYTLVVHGGAGSINKDIPAEIQQRYIETLDSALSIGARILDNGGTALDAVENVIAYFENCPLYNAGKGAVFTWDRKNELDASIMDGSNLMAGAVAGVTHIKNPIRAARKVMDSSPHVMLSGEGANTFADENELEMVENSYFKTGRQFESFERQKALYIKDKKGTVGCVALDKEGNLAAGTSTGGMSLKRWGRIGDSPIISAGTYADNKTCAVSCTGHGEYFIRLGVARDIAARIEYKQIPLQKAAAETIEKLTGIGGTGGIIAVDANGNPVMEFNTIGMFRGYIKSDGEKFVGMFE